MGTKNKPGAFDCYANAKPDEPMFVLLGRDPHAPMLIAMWAAIRAKAGEDPEKVEEAIDCAIECTKFCTKELFVPSGEEMRNNFTAALSMFQRRIDERAKKGENLG